MNQVHLWLLETKILEYVSYCFISSQTGGLDRPHNIIDYKVRNAYSKLTIVNGLNPWLPGFRSGNLPKMSQGS